AWRRPATIASWCTISTPISVRTAGSLRGSAHSRTAAPTAFTYPRTPPRGSRDGWVRRSPPSGGADPRASHPKDAVARRTDGHAVHDRECQPEHVAGVHRVDDAVVPQARAPEVRVRLLVV